MLCLLGNTIFDSNLRTLQVAGGGSEHIQPQMASILRALARRPGRVVLHDTLFDATGAASTLCIRARMVRLRAALRRVGSNLEIRTQWDEGYALLVPDGHAPTAVVYTAQQLDALRRAMEIVQRIDPALADKVAGL